jgi:hypothetical protein
VTVSAIAAPEASSHGHTRLRPQRGRHALGSLRM